MKFVCKWIKLEKNNHSELGIPDKERQIHYVFTYKLMLAIKLIITKL